MRKYVWITLLPAIVIASSWNSWQLFQPFNRNFFSRTADSGYSPGYPAAGAEVEPDVVALWLFDEPSGSIVDEVSGITLSNNFAGSSGVYGVTSSGLFSSLSPGVKAAYALSDTPVGFIKNTATPSLDIGSTTSVTVEAYFSVSRNNADPAWWGLLHYDNSGEAANLFAIYVYTSTATNNLTWYIKSSDNTTKFATWTLNESVLYDGNMHKLRMVWNRTTNLLEAVFDGGSLGTVDASGLSGKTLTCNKIRTHAIWLDDEGSDLTISNIRVSHNATNNSGGPNGG